MSAATLSESFSRYLRDDGMVMDESKHSAKKFRVSRREDDWWWGSTEENQQLGEECSSNMVFCFRNDKIFFLLARLIKIQEDNGFLQWLCIWLPFVISHHRISRAFFYTQNFAVYLHVISLLIAFLQNDNLANDELVWFKPICCKPNCWRLPAELMMGHRGGNSIFSSSSDDAGFGKKSTECKPKQFCPTLRSNPQMSISFGESANSPLFATKLCQVQYCSRSSSTIES